MIEIRLQGTQVEIEATTKELRRCLHVISESKPYRNRHSEDRRVYIKAELLPKSDPSTGIVLTPSFHGEQCQGNGEHPRVECCCDECDNYLSCFPEFVQERKEDVYDFE